jgi:uncharacterized protein
MRARTGVFGVFVALAVGGAGLAACGGAPRASASAGADPRCPSGAATVTVQGDGSAEGPPDQAVISLAVQTQAPSAAAAMASNATKATALVAALVADGIAKAQIQTSGLSVQPNYNSNGTVITSYQVTNSVTVTVNDVARSGTVIDDAASVAGNAVRVNGISFDVQNETPLVSQARAAAVEQASGQARVLATAAGMSLGTLCSLQDNTSLSVPPPIYGPVSAPAMAKAASTPIEAGSEQVTANVTVVYELLTSPSSAASTSTTK